MQMTNEEIVRHYLQAANKNKDVKVLADLNCVSPGEIRAVLAQAGVAGVKMPERIRPRKTEPLQEPRAAEREAAASCPALPGVYERIEAILTALPEDASRYARDNALNLVVSLFSDYVAERLSKEGQDETDEHK